MTDWKPIAAFAVLIVGIVLSRIISERAFRRLDDAMKLAVMDVFSGMRVWSVAPLLALLLLMVASRVFFSGHTTLVFGTFFVCVLAYVTFVHYLIGKKMRSVNVPEDYLRTFMRARWLSYLTTALMLALLLGDSIVRAFR